jgi:hypothetical protein
MLGHLVLFAIALVVDGNEILKDPSTKSRANFLLILNVWAEGREVIYVFSSTTKCTASLSIFEGLFDNLCQSNGKVERSQTISNSAPRFFVDPLQRRVRHLRLLL